MAESIPNWLKKRAYLTPNRTALRFEKKEYTFQEMYEKTVKVCGQLQTLRLNDTAPVAVLLKNNPETVFILFALQMTGYKTVLLNTRLTGAELIYQIKDADVQAVISENDFKEKEKEVSAKLPALQTIFKNDLLSREGSFPALKEEFSLDDICTIMYTSGTTGHPKGVLQTYGNHWWSAIGSALNLGLKEKDCWLIAVPLFHISGFSILIRSVIYGMAVNLHESFQEEEINQQIKSGQVTIISVVSSMLMRLLAGLEDERYPSTFRCMLLGGGPAPQPLLEKCVTGHIPVFQTYGMTETSSQIVTLSPEDSLLKLGSAGKPLFPAQLRIENEDGEEQIANTPGEIVVKGPNVTTGYLETKIKTSAVQKNGWFKTGDIGYVDEEGYLFVLDRRSDLIISGGENVYPAEIEAVLLAHPSVLDAGVVGVDHVTWGQVPIAFVVLAGDTEEEIDFDLFCKARLAPYKVPKKFIIKEKLPRNASKKLLRNQLRQMLKEDKKDIATL